MIENFKEFHKEENFDWCSKIRTKSSENDDKDVLVGVKKRASQRKMKLLQNEALVLKRLKELDPIAASGVSKHVVSPTLIDSLLDFVKSLDISAENTVNAINFVRKIAILGNSELGWDAPIPQPAIRLRNYRNPVSVDKFSHLEKISTEINAFNNYLLNGDFAYLHIEKEFTDDEILLIWGVVICSLSIYSACLDNQCLIRLIDGGWKVQRHKHVWIDVHATPDKNSRLYRIFPDSISLIFLQKICKEKLFKSFKNNKEGSAWLNNAVKKVRSQLPDSFGGSVHEWRSSIEIWHQIHLPAQLLELAKGHPKTTAMDPFAWFRTLIEKPIFQEYTPLIDKDFKTESLSYVSTSRTQSLGNLSPTETYKRLKQILGPKANHISSKTDDTKKKKTKGECVHQLTDLLVQVNQHPSITHAVVGWLIFKLTKSTSKINLSSAYQYLTTFCSYLLSILGEDDLTLVDDESYESVYTHIINNVNSDNSKMAKMQLIVQFHRYIMLNFGATSIHFDNLPGFNGDIGAKAHFVTVDEFEKAKALIRLTINNRNEIAYFVMILCYRCGLRIGEAINLMMNDIHFPSMDLLYTDCAMTLTVRPNLHHSLKTVNANRQLPLHLLLEPNELLEFKLFFEEQCKVKNCHTDPLFNRSFSFKNPIERSEICNIIVTTLREVTNDDEITIHQLRHSFCCLFFQLIFNDLDVTPLPTHWINNNHPVDVNLKNLLLRHTSRSRSPIYQIAEWMGHSSPLMSLSAYMHWGHLPVRQKLDAIFKENIKTNVHIKKIICKLLGITNENLKLKLHKKNGNLHDAVAAYISVPRLNKTQSYIKKSKYKIESKSVLLSDFTVSHWIIYFQVLSKLYDVDEAESYLNIEPGQTYKAIELLRKLSDRSKRNGGYRLFPALDKKSKGRAESLTLFNKLQVIIPKQPSRKEIIDIEEIYLFLEKELKNNRDFILQAIQCVLKNYKHYQKNIFVYSLNDVNVFKKLAKILEGTCVVISTPDICESIKTSVNFPVVISSKRKGRASSQYSFIYAIILLSLKYN